jgi:AcrR family transcriptional regulator
MANSGHNTEPRRPGRPARGDTVPDRERVLDAAEIAIRREGSTVSLDAIAREAGITKPVVYARVGGRAEMANALAERLTLRLIKAGGAAVRGTPFGRDLIASFVVANLRTIREHRELFLYVTGGASDDAPFRSIYLARLSVAPTSQFLAQARVGQGRDSGVADSWAWAIVGMLNFISLRLVSDEVIEIEVVAEQVASLLWSGLSDA